MERSTLWHVGRALYIPDQMNTVLTQVATILACGYAASNIKRYVIATLENRRVGKLTFYDNFFNAIIIAVVANFLSALFDINLGPGFQSLFAAGGVGALVFGMASKGLAEQVVGGMVIKAWDVFNEGDSIILHESNTRGRVVRIGFVETEIEGYDNIRVKMPNSRIFNQRISNISHVKRSQVKQKLRFRYSDLPKMNVLLQTIKDEIQERCSPELICDGSKPFRAHLHDYKEDHVEVLVNCHFRIPPNTGRYLDNRQKVLEAIASAVQKSGVVFAIPAVSYKRETGKMVPAANYSGKLVS